MHSLLGFRFDQLIHEQFSRGANRIPPANLFSIQLLVKDLDMEKTFYTKLLNITPLAETKEYVILPISNEVTLSLMACQKSPHRKKDSLYSRIVGIEFNLETRNIHSLWQKALKLYKEKPSDIITEKNMLVFFIKSPGGTLLRFWQMWAPELVE